LKTEAFAIPLKILGMLISIQPGLPPPMTLLSLKRLLSKKDLQTILHQLMEAIAVPLYIQDRAGNILLGEYQSQSPHQYPIELPEETLGWVAGAKEAQIIASLLSHLATKELEKKALAQETLDRYKEISLLYDLSEKITATLELQAVAELVLLEAKKLIQGSRGSVMLLNPDTRQLEQVAGFGQSATVSLELNQGILGSILAANVGEIINDVRTDDRWTIEEGKICSLIATPLKSQNRAIGVISISSETPVTYTAADLKLFSALAAGAASAIENALLHQHKLREERIKSNLERYIPSQVVQAILEAKGDVSLSPVRKEITILFSDIRNFTAQCEELAPEIIVGYLNEYFTHMVEEIFNHQGTVNKFVGDMIVALFGAPSELINSEKRAIETAIAMQERIQKIPVAWIRDNFNTGIGISSGKVIVGNIGSPRHTDYTAIGDEVNTASRLQAIAKGGQILVSRSIYEATKHQFHFRNFGSFDIKGKRKAVEVFEVLC
jgi:adenylate cyclase